MVLALEPAHSGTVAPRTPRANWLIARHEAAHALVAFLLDMRVTKVTTRPDDDTAGACYWQSPRAGATTVGDRAKDCAVALAARAAMAGFEVAEETFESDDSDVSAGARAAVGPSPVLQAHFITECWHHAQALIADHEPALRDICRQLDALGEIEGYFAQVAQEALASEARWREHQATTYRYVDYQEGDTQA